jgi:hypothetical protein
MIICNGIKKAFYICILAILISILPFSFVCALEKDVSTLVEKYDSVLNDLVASENFSSNLICRNDKIHRPIETRIPQGGVVAEGEDIYGIAGDITEPRGGYF